MIHLAPQSRPGKIGLATHACMPGMIDLAAGTTEQVRHGSQKAAAGPTNRPQTKVIKTIRIIKLKLWPAAGCEAKAAAEIGSRP